jgi:hypothetical protein
VLVALGSPRTAYAVAGAGVLVLVFAGFLLRSRIRVVEIRPHARADTTGPGDVPLPDTFSAAPAFQASAGGDDRPPGMAATRQNA